MRALLTASFNSTTDVPPVVVAHALAHFSTTTKQNAPQRWRTTRESASSLAVRPKQLTTGPLPLLFEKQPKRPASTQPTFTSSGSLPPLHLPETGFVVNPVVGSCTRLQLTNTLNPQEVAVVVQIPLREFAKTSDRVQRNRATCTNGSRFSVGTAVGDMTSIGIEALLDHRQ